MILLRKLYNDQTGRVRTDILSKEFNIGRGTKQGDPLSSLMFNSLLEHVMRPLKTQWEQKHYGLKVGPNSNHQLMNLRFADDVLLIATSQQQITNMLNVLKQAAQVVGLELHPGKTKILSNANLQERVISP